MSKADRDGGGGGVGPSGGSSNSGGGGSAGGTGSTGGFNGRDTPGNPKASDGKRGSTMGKDGGIAPDGGRGNNTPGNPDNPGRRGHTPAEATSTRESARRARASLQTKTRTRGNIVGDNDAQYGAGLSLESAMDNQQTENTLNRRGVTDTVGMSEVDRIGQARQGDAMLSAEDRQREKGIIAGYTSQTMANRTRDILGVPKAVTDLGVSMIGRPENTMQTDVDLGRERANSHEMGAVAGLGVSLGASKIGVSLPGNIANFGVATANAAMDKNMNAILGSPKEGVPDTPGGGNGTRTSAASANARAAMQPRQISPETYSAPVIDRNQYSRGLLSLAQKIR